jgi:hypothetical protein
MHIHMSMVDMHMAMVAMMVVEIISIVCTGAPGACQPGFLHQPERIGR